MKKILAVFFFITSQLFAIDATMEIVKNKSNLPNITAMISVDTTAIPDSYDRGILKLVKKDLVVSGHFDYLDSGAAYHFEQTPEYSDLKNTAIYKAVESENK